MRVAVVLSAYNGERYIAEQIDSIISQELPENCELDIYIRDDGSRDATLEVLSDYEDNEQIFIVAGGNCGVTESFMQLLRSIPDGYDYIALCDQDDRWHHDKLARAISLLKDSDEFVPALYACEYLVCDSQLNNGTKSRLYRSGIGFHKMLFENIISGNTVVMNSALVRIVNRAGSAGVYCHDWWIALVASACGVIRFDERFYCLDYRRTGGNASSTGLGYLAVTRNRIRRFLRGGELEHVRGQLMKLRYELSDLLSCEQIEDLDLLLNRRKRIKRALFPHRLRQTMLSEIVVRLLLLCGKL